MASRRRGPGSHREAETMELWDEERYQQLKQAVRKAGDMFSDRKKAAEIRKKGATDFVTQVDLSVQRKLLEAEGVTFVDDDRVDMPACRWPAGLCRS